MHRHNLSELCQAWVSCNLPTLDNFAISLPTKIGQWAVLQHKLSFNSDHHKISPIGDTSNAYPQPHSVRQNSGRGNVSVSKQKNVPKKLKCNQFSALSSTAGLRKILTMQEPRHALNCRFKENTVCYKEESTSGSPATYLNLTPISLGLMSLAVVSPMPKMPPPRLAPPPPIKPADRRIVQNRKPKRSKVGKTPMTLDLRKQAGQDTQNSSKFKPTASEGHYFSNWWLYYNCHSTS